MKILDAGDYRGTNIVHVTRCVSVGALNQQVLGAYRMLPSCSATAAEPRLDGLDLSFPLAVMSRTC
jgi:hypothetical protein